jgi:hypothetical protein
MTGSPSTCLVNTLPALPHDTWWEAFGKGAFSYTQAYNLTGWPGAVVRGGTSPGGRVHRRAGRGAPLTRGRGARRWAAPGRGAGRLAAATTLKGILGVATQAVYSVLMLQHARLCYTHVQPYP